MMILFSQPIPIFYPLLKTQPYTRCVHGSCFVSCITGSFSFRI